MNDAVLPLVIRSWMLGYMLKHFGAARCLGRCIFILLGFSLFFTLFITSVSHSSLLIK
ncbi:MAG: hypothetical protein NVS2B16_08880 [Chloroflexota bacterium]